MKRSKFTDEQILKIVREGEAGRKGMRLTGTGMFHVGQGNGPMEVTEERWESPVTCPH